VSSDCCSFGPLTTSGFLRGPVLCPVLQGGGDGGDGSVRMLWQIIFAVVCGGIAFFVLALNCFHVGFQWAPLLCVLGVYGLVQTLFWFVWVGRWQRLLASTVFATDTSHM
jgi:hypothetical protein